MRDDWSFHKLGIMREIVRKKFLHKNLADRLLDTWDAELIEGNNWGDQYWGVCRGQGQNHLGRILMDIRESLM